MGRRDRRILYVQYTNPAAYPPLAHSSGILADAGKEIRFLSICPFGTEKMVLPPHPRIRLRRMFSWPMKPLREIHYALFCLWVLLWAAAWRPRWIYASDHFSCPPAWLLSFFPGMRVVYHEHDSPSFSDGAGGSRLLRNARRALARRAELCILPNARRAARFSAETNPPRAPLCVWNCPRREEVRPARSVSREGLRLHYQGSLGPSRLPSSLLRALQGLPGSVTLRLAGYCTVGAPAYDAELRRTAKELGVENRVELVGPVPTRRELFRYAETGDVGIALMPQTSSDRNEQDMEGASNKPFDYLACGMPLLVSDLPAWKALYVQPGYGLACDPSDPESIRTAVKWFLDHPAERIAMGEAGRQRILRDWNYETQFQAVYDAMTREGAHRSS